MDLEYFDYDKDENKRLMQDDPRFGDDKNSD